MLWMLYNACDVSTKATRNAACVFIEDNMKNRRQNAEYLLLVLTTLDLGPVVPPLKVSSTTSTLFFIGECSINQGNLDDLECLSPFGISPLHRSSHSITTESVWLVFLVGQWSCIIYDKLSNTTQDGSISYGDVVEFLEEPQEVPKPQQFQSKKDLYLDNTPSHKKALAVSNALVKSQNNPPTQAMIERIENLNKYWSLLWDSV